MMSKRLALPLAIAAIAATVLALQPARAETVLRWASVGGAFTFDPHGQQHTPTQAIQNQVYESLVRVSDGLIVEPELATEWALVNPTTWEFKLRQGVRFHDGTPFTADDVVFSINRGRGETSELADFLEVIAEVQAVGDRTVRITTSAPDLFMPVRLSNFFIMSRAWAEAHDSVAPTRTGDPVQSFAAAHANGTGPFQLESFEPAGKVVMVRNPDWWGGNVAIDRIVHDAIPDPEERLAVILNGGVDLLIDPPFAALGRIGATSGLKLQQTTELRAIFIVLDHASAELRHSDIKAANPFRDRRVRQALYQAIDIEQIRDEVMNGLSLPAGMIIELGINGYSPELDQRLPYDPDAARTLLSEAGYPGGFSFRLDCPNNRYVNDEAICRAVADDLGKIGIAVTVEVRPMIDHLQKIFKRETNAYLLGWGGSDPFFDSAQVLRDWYATAKTNRYNASGYANPKLDELLQAIDKEVVTYARDALIEEAWRIALDDIPLLPLHHQVIVWALRDDLQLPIDPRAIPWFKDARFNTAGQQ